MKAKELRKRAWDSLKGRYWWSVLVALVAGLFGVISLGTTSGAFTQAKDAAQNGVSDVPSVSSKVEVMFSNLPDKGKFIIFFVLFAIILVGIAMSIIGSAVKLGYCRYNMDLFTDVEQPSMNLLFSRTKIIWKALLKDILEGLLVTVGLIFLIVPGIIIGLMYSQSDYILAENPDLTAVEAMKKSRLMMKGNKWALFCLGLSFIGWDILSGIVPAGALLLAPYTEAANAAFYLDRTGRLKDNMKDLSDIEAKA